VFISEFPSQAVAMGTIMPEAGDSGSVPPASQLLHGHMESDTRAWSSPQPMQCLTWSKAGWAWVVATLFDSTSLTG